MKTKTTRPALTDEQSDLSVIFYDEANDHSKGSFEQIALRVLGSRGFGRSKTAALFNRESQKMFKLPVLFFEHRHIKIGVKTCVRNVASRVRALVMWCRSEFFLGNVSGLEWASAATPIRAATEETFL